MTPAYPSQGRAACPQAAAECLHARISEISARECHSLFTAITIAPVRPTPSFSTAPRLTPAPKGLRSSAQGCRALASAPLGMPPPNREANPPPRHTHRPPAASAKRPATPLPARSRGNPTPSFATPLRSTPAPTGLRNTAQRCRALASAPLGMPPPDREANPPPRHTHRPPAAFAKRPATPLPVRSRGNPTASFANSLRLTPAPKGLRSSAQGQPSLSEATLGDAPSIREANPPPLRTHRSPAASAKRPATPLPAR